MQSFPQRGRCSGIVVGRPIGWASLSAAALLTLAHPGPAQAQVGARIAREPPAAALRLAPGGPPTARAEGMAGPAPQQRRGIGFEVYYDLDVRHRDGKLFNPSTGRFDQVLLRAYSGAVKDPLIPFVGPRVELWPGETFRLTLHNSMSPDDPSCGPSHPLNTLRCFNTLNNHTHGLWVSPSGNGDNVLLSIEPNVSFQYEYNIPPDHPAGTFWYHSHLHGSTAVQVSSGMAGPLVIRGDRVPVRQPDGTIGKGDIDTLLRVPGGEAFKERTVLFQQIAYACRDAAGGIKKNPDGTWLCEDGDVGGIENADQLGPNSWRTSGRYTAMNGEILPTFTGATARTIERWRVIHGGVRDTIKLRFRKLAPEAVAAAASFRPTSAAQRQAFVDQNCTGDPLATFGIATDGLTRPAVNEQIETYFQPGYREDLLVTFPEAGTYCVIDGELEPDQVVNQQAHGRELLGYVTVGPGADDGLTARERIQAALLSAAIEHMPPDIRGRVIIDLANGMKLTGFMRHAPILAVDGRQSAGFTIVQNPLRFQVGTIDANGQLKDAESYDPDHFRELVLGKAEEWTARAFGIGGGHPFHIHVNPFQIVSVIRESDKVDVSALTDTKDNQFAGLKGTWKDTIFLQPGHTITFRTRYERYIGDFVLHCHILDHEDSGMMQNVRISIPGTAGGPSAHHHE